MLSTRHGITMQRRFQNAQCNMLSTVVAFLTAAEMCVDFFQRKRLQPGNKSPEDIVGIGLGVACQELTNPRAEILVVG